jgi:hypothetical protein
MFIFSILLMALVPPSFDQDVDTVLPRQQRFDLLDDIQIKGEGPCFAVDTGEASCPEVAHGDHSVCNCHKTQLKKIYLCIDSMLIYRGGYC